MYHVSAVQGVDERMINVHYYYYYLAMVGVWVYPKLQALVYDILPSTTAVFELHMTGSRKLSANEQ